MMDISATNAFLITTNGTEDRSHRAHRTFQEELTTQLLPVANKEELTTQLLSVANGEPEQSIPPTLQPYLRWITLPNPSRCVWCTQNVESRAPRAKRRKILGEVINGANQGFHSSIPRSRAACGCHRIALCRKSDCWDLYHSHLSRN
jgi:hypothetical protein